MTESGCERVRELLPEIAAGRAEGSDTSAAARHVDACSECRAELELARLLFATRAAVPPGLADSVTRAIRADRRPVARGSRPWWGLSAAAVAALALGIGINSQREGTGLTPVPEFATELDEGVMWSSDDGLLAGAPSVEGLSDEALKELLAELDGGASGGSV
jgi:predicted anti-sigma-YlaC factor YlaD